MGHGLFGPDSVTWRVNGQAVLLVGGGRALLLQVAHPLVAAGVAQHSSYREDPWGRLWRTLERTTQIVFGDAETSARAARRLQSAHAHVQGLAPGGVPYDARDPDLLLWVWATLVDTSVLVYTRYVGPLSLAEIERYYAEQQRFAVACGIPEGHWPERWADLMAYIDDMVESTLRVGTEARAVADAVLRPSAPSPLPAPALRPLAEALNLATVGLLPPTVRLDYGLGWGPRRERLLSASTLTIRRLMPLLPSPLREVRPARVARRRARAA